MDPAAPAPTAADALTAAPADAAARLLALSPADLLAVCGLLAGELAAARTAADPASVTREELQRRCGFLAARAVPAGLPGKLLCRWCGTPKNGFNPLRQHYERIHADEVRAEPAAGFADGFGPVAGRARPAAAAFVKANAGRFRPGNKVGAKSPAERGAAAAARRAADDGATGAEAGE